MSSVGSFFVSYRFIRLVEKCPTNRQELVFKIQNLHKSLFVLIFFVYGLGVIYSRKQYCKKTIFLEPITNDVYSRLKCSSAGKQRTSQLTQQ